MSIARAEHAILFVLFQFYMAFSFFRCKMSAIVSVNILLHDCGLQQIFDVICVPDVDFGISSKPYVCDPMFSLKLNKRVLLESYESSTTCVTQDCIMKTTMFYLTVS